MATAALKDRAARFCKEHNFKSVRPLPPDALEWDDYECELYFRTFGQFSPRRALEEHCKRHSQPLRPVSFREVVLENDRAGDDRPRQRTPTKGRVSVIVPTIEARRAFHESLWESFAEQKWPDRELIVVETYHTRPSGFLSELAREDPRVTYICFRRRLPNGKQAEAADRKPLLGGRNEHFDFSVGLKRNIAIYLASGEFVAHFDDDDLYAPNYLTATVKRLKSAKTSALKLSTWFVLDLKDGAITQCDPMSQGILPGYRRSADSAEKEKRLYGCGFSYVYRRSIALSMPFKDINIGEDHDFVSRILDEGGKPAVALMKDTEGICLRVQHDKNLAECVPARDVEMGEVSRLQFRQCPGFQRYLEILHIGLAMPDFVEMRFPDVDKSIQGNLEIALLNDWSQNCVLGVATGRECEKTLDALLREAKAGVSKDELRKEVTSYMEEKFSADAAKAEDGRSKELVETDEVGQDGANESADTAEEPKRNTHIGAWPQGTSVVSMLNGAVAQYAKEFGAS